MLLRKKRRYARRHFSLVGMRRGSARHNIPRPDHREVWRGSRPSKIRHLAFNLCHFTDGWPPPARRASPLAILPPFTPAWLWQRGCIRRAAVIFLASLAGRRPMISFDRVRVSLVAFNILFGIFVGVLTVRVPAF